MDLTDVARIRWFNQQLAGTSIQSACQMVQWLTALQAQEYAQSKWALGLRIPALVDNDIERSFTEGEILRTHVLRPTWHFVSKHDIYWMLHLTASRVHLANAFMYRKLELDNKVFSKCHDIMIKLLQGGKQQTRTQINEVFAKQKIFAAGHRLSYIMMHAELNGLICSGARQHNQFTYALLEERVTKKVSMSTDEALAELTKRYFKSKGPATTRDFATWSGLTLTQSRKGVAMIAFVSPSNI